MARYPAIAGTSQAILGLLQGAAAETEFAGAERDTFLYELPPHRVKLGQVSLHSLIGWIRMPAWSAYVSEAS